MLDIAKKLTIDENNDGVTDIYGLTSGGNMTSGWLPLRGLLQTEIIFLHFIVER